MPLRLADRWFEWKTIDDSITLFWEPHVGQFYRCNIWLVRGRDRDLLVDTGTGIRSLKQDLARFLEKPVIAVATHIHFDHIGGHYEFDERVVHKAEAHVLADPDPVETVTAKYVSDDLVDALPYEGFTHLDYGIRGAPATRVVDEGDVIHTGDRAFAVMHLPGHSPGSIGLWESRTGTLFSGDAIYDGQILDDLHHSNVPDYIATMERLRTLPARVVHAGHRASFGRDRLVALCDAYLAGKNAA